ncbi:hypothetical protein Patl1_03923 [Pistacia atlantica]|uniref:Uncharacterized protein n=1 Tax=Pistacia atlantica TaxID=434234 RepID=A0ACC1BVU8_9ROSI|nr:hypothetical protein Patl1_03923 [Pistacia atlantica]
MDYHIRFFLVRTILAQLATHLCFILRSMDTLKKQHPFSGLEGLNGLKKIAERLEEKIHTTATSQTDYLRKISLKMCSIDSKSQNPKSNSLPSNTAGNSNNPQNKEGLSGLKEIAERLEDKIYTGAISQMCSMDSKSQNPMSNSLPSNTTGNSNNPSDKEGFNGLKEITERLENKIYIAATSQTDYLQKISLKMCSMDSKSQNPMSNSLPSNTAGNSNNPPDKEGLNGLKEIVERLEDKIYIGATSQTDYLRKISLKMCSMDSKSQNPMSNSLPSNTAGNSNNPPDKEGLNGLKEIAGRLEDKIYIGATSQVKF